VNKIIIMHRIIMWRNVPLFLFLLATKPPVNPL